MKFIKEIREELGFNPYVMTKKMEIKTVQQYLSFEDSKQAVNVENLIKLWELSGLSAKAFMERMREEVNGKHNGRETKK